MSEALQIQQEILSYLEAHRDRYLDAIRTLARIPAPPNHEELRAQWCKQHLEELGATGVYIDDALNVIFPYGVEEGANDPVRHPGSHRRGLPDTEPLPFHEENGRFYAPASATTPPTPSLSWRWRPWPSTSNSNQKPASSLCSIPARRDWATSRVCAG